MRYFPVFLDLRARTVLVQGGGEEALRKVRLLLKTEARIVVVAENLHTELQALVESGRIGWHIGAFSADLVTDAALVFAAGEPHEKEAVSRAALAAGVQVNVVDRADLSTLIIPAIVDRDPIVVAIGSEGTAPVLAQNIRSSIEAMLPPALGGLAVAAEKLRALVADRIGAGASRRAFWQRFFFGRPRDLFLAGDADGFERAVGDLIDTAAAAPVAGRITYVPAVSGDPELLTLKAQRRLREADVIVHDAGIEPAILEYARRDAVRVPVPGLHDDFNTLRTMIRDAETGRQVVRLTLFDAADLAARARPALSRSGVDVEVLPGVFVEERWAPAFAETAAPHSVHGASL
ncbi:MAG: NAD(P)-dependent oxidoreductase [Hyphomicrobiales bacterium]